MTDKPISARFQLPLASVDSAGLFVSPGLWRHAERCVDQDVLMFVRTGALHIREGDRDFVVAPDEALILRANIPHVGTTDVAPSLSYFWLHFKLREPDDGEGAIDFHIDQHLKVARPERLDQLFRLYIGDIIRGDASELSLMLQMCQILAEAASPPIADRSTKDQAVLANKAAAYLRTRFVEPVSIADVADALCCNPKYLSRVYREVYGITLTQFLRDLRMEHARYFLTHTTMTVNEIAAACGFAHTEYFVKIFRSETGQTPGSYRRAHGRLWISMH